MAVVLVVEDRPEIQTLLGAVIGRAGHQVVVAGSAAEALASLSHRPQLIFVDLGLPDRSGVALAMDFRQDPRTRDVPLVIVTARPDAAKQIAAVGLTRAQILAKPFRFEAVAGIIREHLGGD